MILRTLLSLLLLAALSTGCTERYDGPPTQFVEGVVTVDGRPAEGVKIHIVPKTPGVGEEARGISDQNGRYTLSSLQGRAGQGGMTGEYAVTAHWGKKHDLDKPFVDSASGDTITYEIREALPKLYHNVKSTPLTMTIVEGKNTINLELKSKP